MPKSMCTRWSFVTHWKSQLPIKTIAKLKKIKCIIGNLKKQKIY